MKKRIDYIDVARGISIICIILGHLGNPFINRVVYTFHVPLFFFITGYFTKNNSSIKNFIKNKFRTLIIPYTFTCCVIIFLGTIKGFFLNGVSGAATSFIEWLYASIYGAGDSYSYPFYIKAIGAIWFLLATFWGTIFLRITFNLQKNIEL